MNYASAAVILLDSNLLPYLDVAVFQSIVTGFRDKGFDTSFISASKSKKTIEIYDLII